MTEVLGGEAHGGIRLFVAADLAAAAVIGLSPEQSHYVGRVMRRGIGDELLLFNGRHGEWLAKIEGQGRGWCSAALIRQTRPQTPMPDLWLIYAPIKRARGDFLAEKAAELGVSALWPVFTRRTIVSRVNTERLTANAVEASEQCERLTVPEIFEPADFNVMIAKFPRERRIVICDESGAGEPIAAALNNLTVDAPYAIVTGPEGGFEPGELDGFADLPFVTRVTLGPRLLRADTAAIAALSCFQALLGDWRTGRPRTISRV